MKRVIVKGTYCVSIFNDSKLILHSFFHDFIFLSLKVVCKLQHSENIDLFMLKYKKTKSGNVKDKLFLFFYSTSKNTHSNYHEVTPLIIHFLAIVVRTHLKQNESNHFFLVDYSRCLNIFQKYVKNNENFC